MRSVERGWLAELDPDTRATVERLGRVQRYQAGEALFLEGDVGSKVIVIRSGFLKVVATSEDGHATVLAVRGPGDLMGELSAIDEAPRSATGYRDGAPWKHKCSRPRCFPAGSSPTRRGWPSAC